MKTEMQIDVVLTVSVEVEHLPAERAETGPEAQYPGAPEQIEIGRVHLNGLDVTNHLTGRETAEIEREVWLQLDSDRDVVID
jgi:hypothetical protein